MLIGFSKHSLTKTIYLKHLKQNITVIFFVMTQFFRIDNFSLRISRLKQIISIINSFPKYDTSGNSGKRVSFFVLSKALYAFYKLFFLSYSIIFISFVV